MDIQVMSLEKDITEIQVNGRLDGITMPELEQRLEVDCFREQKFRLAFNLEKLDYISSAGLRVMLLALKKTTAMKGKLVLFGLNSSVHEIFKLSGFSSIYTIVSTREEALATMQ